MVEKVKEIKKDFKVPTMVELAKKKATAGLKQKPKEKKSQLPVLAAIILVLIVIIAFAVLFLMPKYKYSFNISGVNYVSNDFTPSEFFPAFKDNNSFLIIIDLKDNQSNTWMVNAMNLWLVALNADGKSVQSLVRLTDATGVPLSCSTNDSNIMSSRDISVVECNSMINDSAKSRVILTLSNENKAILENGRLEIFATGAGTVSNVNYYVIKQMYSDFDNTLAIVNERINGING
ncbi:MAG: hypothetical protein WCI04_01375 [archaeon]